MRRIFRNLAVGCALLCSLGFRPGRCGAVEFAAPKTYPVGTNPSTAVFGDFNGDGKPDIAVANGGSGNISILLGNGDGTFQSAETFGAGLSPGSIAVADFNMDGKADLVLFQPGDPQNGAAGAVSVLLGNGDGTFQSPKLRALAAATSALLVADFNVDTRPDLAVSEFDSATNVTTIDIFLGKGDGDFQPAKPTSIPGSVNGVFVSADFNDDLKPDVAGLVAGGISILFGNGDGTFHQGSFVATKPDFTPGTILVAKLNSDSKPDLLMISSKTTTECFPLLGCIKVTNEDAGAFLGKGDGFFESELALSDYKGGPILLGDFNGDGKPDIGYRVFWVNLGRGDGTFASQQFSNFAGDVSGLPCGATDLNGDGLDDLVIVDGANNAVSVALNTSPHAGSDLAIVSSCCSDGPQAPTIGVGSRFNYTATVLNEGPLDASNVTFTDTLPAGVSFLSANADKGDCSTAGAIVSCRVSTLASASDVSFTIILAADAAGTITNAMEVSSATTDPVPANNVASQTNTIVFVHSLTVRLDGAGSGSVASNPGSINCSSTGGSCTMAQVLQGTVVNLKASPAQGSVFSGWAGACTSTDSNVCSVTLNSDQSVTATFQLAPDFSLSPALTKLSVKRGGQVSESVSFEAQGGFSGTIAVSCSVSGPTPMPACAISPNSVSVGSTATLTVSAAGLSAALSPQPHSRFSNFYLAFLPFGALSLAFAGGTNRKRRGMWFLCLALCTAALLPAACGGGTSDPPPPVLNYTVTVTATSGVIQHSTSIRLTMN